MTQWLGKIHYGAHCTRYTKDKMIKKLIHVYDIKDDLGLTVVNVGLILQDRVSFPPAALGTKLQMKQVS
jgi:hypothetical protein